MSPVNRKLSGAALQLSLADEIREVRSQLAAGGERTARTIVKDGPLRVTLVGLGAAGTMRPHKADGPITVQVLEGEIEFEVEGERRTLAVGSLFALEAGLTHSVMSREGGVFLLTVVSTTAGSESEQAR